MGHQYTTCSVCYKTILCVLKSGCSTSVGWEWDRAARLRAGNETVQHVCGLGMRPCSMSGGWEWDCAACMGAGNETVQHAWGLGMRPCSTPGGWE